MTEFKVDTIQLRECADQIQHIYWDMDRVRQTLDIMQGKFDLQIQAGPLLMLGITDCKHAIGNQSRDLRKLYNGLEAIASLYKDCEKELKKPSTGETVLEKLRDGLDDVVDFVAKCNSPLTLIAAMWNIVTGDEGEVVSGAKGLLSGSASLLKNISTITSDSKTEWWKVLLNHTPTESATFSELLKKSVGDYFPAADANFATQATAIAKWAGVVLSFLGSGIDNYDEFEGDLTNGRFWAETGVEGVLGVVELMLITAGVGAVMSGPPGWAVAGVGTCVALVADYGSEQLFGKDLTELLSDAILDTAEWYIDEQQYQIERGLIAAGEGDWLTVLEAMT